MKVDTEINDDRVLQTNNDYYSAESQEIPVAPDSYSSVQKIRNGQDMIGYNQPVAADYPVIDSFMRENPTPDPSYDLLKQKLIDILDYEDDNIMVVEVEKKKHSVWFLTVFLLFILLLVVLWLYFMLTGTRPSDITNWCRKAGMRLKNGKKKKKRLPHHKKYYEDHMQPLLQPISDGATSDSSAITEKTETLVHSRRDWDNEQDILETGEESMEIPPKIESKQRMKRENKKQSSNRHRHKRHSGQRHLVVKAPVSDGESIKLVITTDVEDCCDETENCVVRESSAGEAIYISEMDFDDEDHRSDVDDNVPEYVRSGKHDQRSSTSGTRSTGSSVKLSSLEERRINERYTGPNEPHIHSQRQGRNQQRPSRLSK
ncbi:unnamed protein product [Orchesella dallaii]|uniref:Uncharacterized protein n=1 Tax=Orchesella dallaii TaxID=48710 RepID=A0ABP1PQJ2_9HEXA